MSLEYLNIKNDVGGIYIIVNMNNGKKYIGKTNSFKLRFYHHKRHLELKKHGNSYLQNDYNKHDGVGFVFTILEPCEDLSKDHLTVKEQIYLDEIFKIDNVRDFYYNISEKSIAPETNKGKKLSSEHKKKIGDANRGKKRNESFKLTNKGKKLSQEHKEKISNAHKGLKHSKETKNKIGTSSLGRRHTNDSKEKISKSKLKEKHHYYGKELSEEHKDKISKSNRGKNHFRYISDISAENIQTGEVIITQSALELSILLNVSINTVMKRLDKNNKLFTENPVKKVWRIFRIV